MNAVTIFGYISGTNRKICDATCTLFSTPTVITRDFIRFFLSLSLSQKKYSKLWYGMECLANVARVCEIHNHVRFAAFHRKSVLDFLHERGDRKPKIESETSESRRRANGKYASEIKLGFYRFFFFGFTFGFALVKINETAHTEWSVFTHSSSLYEHS